jgi:ferredoxin
MKVSVDFDVCASTGACMQVCPRCSRCAATATSTSSRRTRRLADKVREAADLCPTAAITVED